MNRQVRNALASGVMRSITVLVTMFIFVMILVLFIKSAPLLATKSIAELLFSSSWHPSVDQFGFYPFIIGTLAVTSLAMLIALPICFLTAIYVAEYATGRIRGLVNSMIDLLAGVPSVVIGMWGVITIVPLVRMVGEFVGATTTGYSILAGGIVLAIMVFPSIISVSQEVLRAVPASMREASFALGATKWETVKYVVVRKSLAGIVAAMILGFSRAFGETIAVLMVVGNVARVPSSLFDPGYPLPALIANNYENVMSMPLYSSALLFAALILLLVVATFTVLGRIVLIRLRRRSI
ncbi:MAG TPA: phosphate ABC transporter permease subunit PstC [Candidatus Saccharimonadales bacterium]|nr:phosphate ABC transporter permease subunit PstC [Candidatus Saccharimonadales bacterium]